MRVGFGYRIGNFGVFASQSLNSIGRTQRRRRHIQPGRLYLPDLVVEGVDLSAVANMTFNHADQPPYDTVRIIVQPGVVSARKREKAQKIVQKNNPGVKIDLVFP